MCRCVHCGYGDAERADPCVRAHSFCAFVRTHCVLLGGLPSQLQLDNRYPSQHHRAVCCRGQPRPMGGAAAEARVWNLPGKPVTRTRGWSQGEKPLMRLFVLQLLQLIVYSCSHRLSLPCAPPRPCPSTADVQNEVRQPRDESTGGGHADDAMLHHAAGAQALCACRACLCCSSLFGVSSSSSSRVPLLLPSLGFPC